MAFWNTTALTATAAPSVTTARLMPRTRTAGRPSRTPTGTATSAARMIGNGNGIPRLTPSLETMNPPMPANAICISEIWPTNPVTTTADSAMMTVTSDVEMALW